MVIKKIGVIANIEKDQSPLHVGHLLQWAARQNVTVFLEQEIARKIGNSPGYTIGRLKKMTELLVVIGGDGTLLRTARLVKDVPIPIMGINLGVFGYLTEVNLNEMTSVMELVIQGQFRTETRMMLDVLIRRGQNKPVTHSVLNDVVINRGSLSRMVSLETFVDGRFLTTYRADGLIVSTPTGSTAYSLSAGGPIILPTQELIIINPICPHTLTNRPIILPSSSRISVTLWTKEKGATVTLDGQESFTLKTGDTIEIVQSRFATNLVASQHHDYLE
ncbi:MAG: NAD(+)/NADH kinase, partial [Smithellaceae bacterium]|nr:NAD(+)/NADH kinase [Smithellaceae bacterium]